MPHRLVDHTADLMVEAEGATREEALLGAADGLVEVLTGRPSHQARADREVLFTVEAPDMPSLVVAFLSEILWILESQGTMWLQGGVVLEEAQGMHRVTARGNGVHYDPTAHGRGIEVKAVTYHLLEFERHGPGWRLRVILDV